MNQDVVNLVACIHGSGTRLVLVVNGGSEAISSLLTVPGASQSVLLAIAPYANTALIEWLGSMPEQFCSARTARAMAMVAFEKARKLVGDSSTSDGTGKLIGVACTVSLASDRPKRGPHRFYVATQSADTTTCVHVELEKGSRTRAEEEHLVSVVILNEIAAASGLADRVTVPLLPSELPQRTSKSAPTEWQDLLSGKSQQTCARGSPESPRAIFPGAFNPLHDGHRELAEKASQILGTPVAFEISIANVDKPPLDFIEIADRLEQFDPNQGVWLTRAPTFAEKAAQFPGVTFVVGADTIERIAEPRYYHDNVPAMLRAIEQLVLAGCRFLVFGRKFEGTFQGLDDLSLPPSLGAICQEVPEGEFRKDISSTELRRNQSSE